MAATKKATTLMPTDTPAIVQSGWFAALAGHLADHPDLCPVNSTSAGVQLQCTDANAAAELVKWADTLDGEVLIEVKDSIDAGLAYVRFGHINAWDDEITGIMAAVRGLAWTLGSPAFVRSFEWERGGTAWITVDGLRTFAESGERPEPVTAPVF